MDTKTRNEIVGRLWLWTQSISKTKYLLELAFRTNLVKQEDSKLVEQDTYTKTLQEFVEQQPDYKNGHILSSHRDKFNETYSRAFPTWLECCAIYDASVELAIVYFCQIFNRGNIKEGEATTNNSSFIDKHLQIIIDDIFSTDEEKANFNFLKNKIKTCRDKVIGHLDAEAYNIEHASHISIMKGPNIVWREIDLVFWHSFLGRMTNSIYNYSNRLKLQS